MRLGGGGEASEFGGVGDHVAHPRWQGVQDLDELIAVVHTGIGIRTGSIGVCRDLAQRLVDSFAPPPGRRLVDQGSPRAGIRRTVTMYPAPVPMDLDERLLHEVLGATHVPGEEEADPHEP